MTRLIRVIFFGTILSVLATACATVQDPGQSGFLSDYSNLEEIDANQLLYDSGKVGNYSKCSMHQSCHPRL